MFSQGLFTNICPAQAGGIMENRQVFPLVCLSRLRMATDGQGITTLAVGAGCPLRCQYCINAYAWKENCRFTSVNSQGLYDLIKRDDLYFQATEGGITFGGGEPLLHAAFIREFRMLCEGKWRITAETSLNVPELYQQIALECVDEFIVDIKDMDPEIYFRYTGAQNTAVKEGLKLLIRTLGSERVLVRVPHIPGFNTADNVARSIEQLHELGVKRIDEFTYICPPDALGSV